MGKIIKKEKEISHDLIMAVVNHGFSDELVNIAREAGVSGGTIINARAQAHDWVVNFFGISVQEEKDIILLLVDRGKKVSIMKVLSETHGLNSKANGIVFSMPVDDVMGININDANNANNIDTINKQPDKLSETDK